jgi:hypothetical protein
MTHSSFRSLCLAAAAMLCSQLSLAGSSLSGLYLKMSPMMGNAASGMTQWNYYYFWADGRYCEKLPVGGMESVDYGNIAKAYPNLCGSYVFSGSQISLTNPQSPKPYQYPVSKFDGTNFVMGAYATVKVATFKPGERLAGTYAGARLIDPWRDQVFVLNADGSFTLDDRPQYGAGGPPSRKIAGTYMLGGNTLTLQGPAGAERYTVFREPGTATLVVDGDKMRLTSGDAAGR